MNHHDQKHAGTVQVLADLTRTGRVGRYTSEQARRMGAFGETAISLEDALDAAVDDAAMEADDETH